jgi:hypothetical protein
MLNAHDQMIVHQRKRWQPRSRRSMERVGVELGGKRLGPETRQQRMHRRGLRRPEYGAESARVVVAQDHTVLELDVDVIVGLLLRPIAVYPQAAGHPQMYDEGVCADPKQ